MGNESKRIDHEDETEIEDVSRNDMDFDDRTEQGIDGDSNIDTAPSDRLSDRATETTSPRSSTSAKRFRSGRRLPRHERQPVSALPAEDITPEISPESSPSVPPPSTTEADPSERTTPLFSRIEKVAAIEDRVSLAMKTLGAVAPAASAAADRLTDSARVLASATQGLLQGVTDTFFTAPPPREIDRFGRDPQFETEVLRFFERLYRHYFRVSVQGIENVPNSGPALLVANHSGALPWDAAMLKTSLLLDHPKKRSLRPLSEDFVIHFPFLGVFLNRFGTVRASQENAEALLRDGEVVAVFPEGTKGLGKPFRKRYRLQRFGRGGFVRLAMRTGVPVIPVAIVGAEEIHPLLTRIVRPVAPLGLPYVPVTPTFPLLGPLGLIPLPSKWMIEFGQPIVFDNDGADDELTIQRRTEDVRSDIQSRIDRMLAQRRSAFF